MTSAGRFVVCVNMSKTTLSLYKIVQNASENSIWMYRFLQSLTLLVLSCHADRNEPKEGN